MSDRLLTAGSRLISDERLRQLLDEGHSVASDVERHADKELALAAWCYLGDYTDLEVYSPEEQPAEWPWTAPTPDDPIRQLAKAGALIAAEIDRLLATRGRTHAEVLTGTTADRNDPALTHGVDEAPVPQADDTKVGT